MKIMLVHSKPRTGVLAELFDMLREELEQAGFRAVVGEDGASIAEDTDVLILFGDIARLGHTIQMLEEISPRPRTLLWQLDTLPPPGLSDAEFVEGFRDAAKHARGILKQVSVRDAIRRIVPRHLWGPLKSVVIAARRVSLPGSSRFKPLRPMEWQDYRPILRFERLRTIEEAWRSGIVDHVLVSIPEHRVLLARRKVDSELVQLLYQPRMRCDDCEMERDIDVLFFGTWSARREIILRKLENDAKKGGFRFVSIQHCFGEERKAFLARAKMVVAINADEAFWEFLPLRLIIATACGTLTLAEPTGDTSPFVPGVHFVPVTPADLLEKVHFFLNDPGARGRIVEAAQEVVFSELSMERMPALISDIVSP